MEKKNNSFIYKTSKRTIDIIGSIVGLIFLVPLTIIVWIMDLINKDGAKIFYTQKRIGKNGKPFTMIKFRSMAVNADEQLKRYLEEHPDEKKNYKKNKKLKEDFRVTKTGKFIRKTSIDEWPQFIQVLTGKMSIVGPRPYLPREKEDMGEYYDKITKVKPGLTGLWQIRGRSNLSFDERLKIDNEYIEKRSLLYYIKILLKTFGKVVKREGAE